MSWLTWSFIPGLHWLAWIQAGILTRNPWYFAIALAYALPSLMIMLAKSLPFRFILLSWVLGLVHIQLQKPEINRRIAPGNTTSAPPDDDLMQALLQAALNHEGCLTVTQGVLETGASFSHVERVLNAMVESGYVYQRNNPDTGVIEYVFNEMP